MQELFQMFLQYAKSFSIFFGIMRNVFQFFGQDAKNHQVFENKQSVFTFSGVIQPSI